MKKEEYPPLGVMIRIKSSGYYISGRSRPIGDSDKGFHLRNMGTLVSVDRNSSQTYSVDIENENGIFQYGGSTPYFFEAIDSLSYVPFL